MMVQRVSNHDKPRRNKHRQPFPTHWMWLTFELLWGTTKIYRPFSGRPGVFLTNRSCLVVSCFVPLSPCRRCCKKIINSINLSVDPSRFGMGATDFGRCRRLSCFVPLSPCRRCCKKIINSINLSVDPSRFGMGATDFGRCRRGAVDVHLQVIHYSPSSCPDILMILTDMMQMPVSLNVALLCDGRETGVWYR